MKRSSLFGHVIELHDIVRASKQPADNVVRDFARTRHYLGSKDRRFIADMVFGLIRNFKLLLVYAEETIRQTHGMMPARDVPSMILVAVYCVKLHAERIDDLISDLSGLWRVYLPDMDCRLFLSTLQSVTLPKGIESDAILSIATRFSYPESIVREWVGRYGIDEAGNICAALHSPAPVTVRVNTLATSVERCQAALQEEGVDSHRTNLSPVGLILSKRINVQAHPSFKAGFFEMQDEGSQLISMLVQPMPGMTVIDACAGGGGKALHLAAIMRNDGSVTACDVDRQRLRNLEERMHRAGVSIVHPCVPEHDQEATVGFDRLADAVLIDAPCSGVGTFRRNPALKMRFTNALVESLALTQSDVLDKYSSLVKPGGRLVYATCTLLERENEGQVAGFLKRHPDFGLVSAPGILLSQGVNVESHSPFFTSLPHKTTTDGFFAAVMLRR